MEIEEGVPTEPTDPACPAVATDDCSTATGEAADATSDQAAAEGETGVSIQIEVSPSEPSETSQLALETPGLGENGGDIDVTNSSDGVDECAVCLCLLCEPVELGCNHIFWCASHRAHSTITIARATYTLLIGAP